MAVKHLVHGNVSKVVSRDICLQLSKMVHEHHSKLVYSMNLFVGFKKNHKLKKYDMLKKMKNGTYIANPALYGNSELAHRDSNIDSYKNRLREYNRKIILFKKVKNQLYLNPYKAMDYFNYTLKVHPNMAFIKCLETYLRHPL